MAKQRGWVVQLTGNTANRQRAANIYGGDYFPRQFHYKADAERLVLSLSGLNIQAECVRADKPAGNPETFIPVTGDPIFGPNPADPDGLWPLEIKWPITAEMGS